VCPKLGGRLCTTPAMYFLLSPTKNVIHRRLFTSLTTLQEEKPGSSGYQASSSGGGDIYGGQNP